MTIFFSDEDAERFTKQIFEACDRAWDRIPEADKARFDKGTFEYAYTKAINDNFEKIFFM